LDSNKTQNFHLMTIEKGRGRVSQSILKQTTCIYSLSGIQEPNPSSLALLAKKIYMWSTTYIILFRSLAVWVSSFSPRCIPRKAGGG
jgi:hypothetical protein